MRPTAFSLLSVPAEPIQVSKPPPANEAQVVAEQEAEGRQKGQACHNQVDNAQEQVSPADPGVGRQDQLLRAKKFTDSGKDDTQG